MAVVSIQNDADFSLHVLHKRGLVIACFWAPWCSSCQQLGDEIEQIASVIDPSVYVVSVNVDMRKKLAETYDISAVPALLFFLDGVLVQRLIGSAAPDEISKQIRHILAGTE